MFCKTGLICEDEREINKLNLNIRLHRKCSEMLFRSAGYGAHPAEGSIMTIIPYRNYHNMLHGAIV